jgi:hypothetical protein
VRLEDVRPREQLTWPAEQHTARVETFDGVELSVRLAQIDDGYWATFDARAVAPSTPTASADTVAAQPAASAADEANPAEADAGDGAAGADNPAEAGAAGDDDEGSAPDDASAAEPAPPLDPAQLNQRLGKWAYRIPEHLFNRLSTARSEFVADQDGTS